jgi:hypothetical protein
MVVNMGAFPSAGGFAIAMQPADRKWTRVSDSFATRLTSIRPSFFLFTPLLLATCDL